MLKIDFGGGGALRGVHTPPIFDPTPPVDRAHFFTYVIKFLRYSIAPNRNYVHYKVKFLGQNLASSGLRLLPIMNTNKEKTPIFFYEKIEKINLYLLHLDLSLKKEISTSFEAE
jgi:hypothetical protein